MKQYKYIYGPVNSRRLGASLGVDMVTHKTCQLDCVYCECGATTVLTTERREYVSADSIIAELDDYLSSLQSSSSSSSQSPIKKIPDYVTFGGSGEPTLNSGLGKIIAHMKKNYPSQKLALLTNSILLHDENVRREILPCDLILPSLDAATDRIFTMINKPAKNICYADVIDGLIKFASIYKGTLWLEIFIAQNVNDNDEEILLLKDIVTRINPSRIQLNSLDRPGTDTSLITTSRADMLRIAEMMKPLHAEIVARCF